MFYRPAFLGLSLALFASGIGTAAPITYSYSGLFSGNLNGVAFSLATGSVTGLGDTSTVIMREPSFFLNSLAGTTFNISGVGSGSFTQPSNVFVADTSFGFAIGTIPATTDFMDSTSDQFVNYGLNTAKGPFVVSPVFGGTISTTAGVLNIFTTSETFTAALVATPEPASLLLVGSGLLAIVGSAVRRRWRVSGDRS